MPPTGLRIEDFRALPTDAERRSRAAMLLDRIAHGDQEALRAYLDISMRLFGEDIFSRRGDRERRKHMIGGMSDRVRDLVTSRDRFILMEYLKHAGDFRDRVKVLFLDPRMHSPLALKTALAGFDRWTMVTVVDANDGTARVQEGLAEMFGLSDRIEVRRYRSCMDPLDEIPAPEYGLYDGFITERLGWGVSLDSQFMDRCMNLQPAFQPGVVKSLPGDLGIHVGVAGKKPELTQINLGELKSSSIEGVVHVTDLSPAHFPLDVQLCASLRGPSGRLMNLGYGKSYTSPWSIGGVIAQGKLFKGPGMRGFLKRCLALGNLKMVHGRLSVNTGASQVVKFERTGGVY